MRNAVPIERIPVAVVVFTMGGCPACEAYMPRLLRVAERYQRCLPTLIVDVDEFPRAADRYRIVSTPTTLILRNGTRSFRHIDGAGDDVAIESLYQAAVTGQGCEL